MIFNFSGFGWNFFTISSLINSKSKSTENFSKKLLVNSGNLIFRLRKILVLSFSLLFLEKFFKTLINESKSSSEYTKSDPMITSKLSTL